MKNKEGRKRQGKSQHRREDAVGSTMFLKLYVKTIHGILPLRKQKSHFKCFCTLFIVNASHYSKLCQKQKTKLQKLI